MESRGSPNQPPDRRVFRRVHRYGGSEVDPSRWPATVPAVAQILADGLDLPAGVTVLTGENGVGKSAVVELIAEACGLNPQGGSAKSSFQTRASEPGVGAHLWAERGPAYPAWGYFLRADTMHGLYTYLEENRGRRPERFHELSHGEGFLEMLRTRINQPGFYLMDEPDAPLSFVSSLGLVALLHDLGRAGAQVIVATHSPVVAAVPGARILELGSWGFRPARWDELELVASWRQFLGEPQSFLRHLVDDQPEDECGSGASGD
ncbi:MAG TPA: ABC transporter [Streptosporangiaceae bacterium]|nr:ABC transporter [Streptosporangiaceae bacterium]